MSAAGLTLTTASPEATEAVGRRLAELLPAAAGAVVVALRGGLATGKTCLVRGMAAHFAQGVPVHSPTFTLVNEYGASPKLTHLDLYRLESVEEVADLGYAELFEPEGVCAVEWAERAEPLLPSARLDVFLEHAGEDRRRLTFTDHGIMPEGWQEAIRRAVKA